MIHNQPPSQLSGATPGMCSGNCAHGRNGCPGFQPSVWGPGLWMTLHTMTLNYPVAPSKDERAAYIRFFESLGKVLPCEECKEHFSRHFEQAAARRSRPGGEDVFGGRDALAKWLFQVHGEVNKRKGKPDTFRTYDDMVEFYSQFRSDRAPLVGTLYVTRRKQGGRPTPIQK